MLQEVLAKLNKVRRISDNKYMACCPAHKEKNPSLVVSEKDGKVLVHCFSGGCSFNEIVEATGGDYSIFGGNRSSEQNKFPYSPYDAFKLLANEVSVVLFTSENLVAGNEISEADFLRLRIANKRIVLCQEALSSKKEVYQFAKWIKSFTEYKKNEKV